MKKSNIILAVLILSTISLIFSGCGGGGTTPPINHSPTITSLTASPQSPIEIDQSTVITCSASDPDGDPLAYTWTKTGGTITGTGSAITWLAPDIEGTYITTCTVSDGELTDEQSISIDVEQDLPPDTTEPEPIEVVSAEIDLEEGGVIEVIDPESIINGVKLIIPPISSEKRGGKSIATITISYIDDPYSLELPNNRGFLLPPVVINSDVTLDVECILEIPYTEDNLSNMGLSSNENLKVYRYNYNSSSWEEVPINKRSSRDMSDILEIIFRPEDIDSPYACTFLNADPPSDLGLPQPGDLLYKLSNYKGIEGWLPGHVGIYVGEFEKDSKGNPYNVIEELFGGVKRNYFNPISDFSRGATYMGARQPESGILNPGQRKVIVAWAEAIAELELPYTIGQSFPGILFGMLQGNMVKGALGSYNCVGLAEKAYEIAGVNGGQGLVSDWDEGNLCNLALAECGPAYILTPAEQYNKTELAEGYTVSGRVTDSQGNGIPGVTLNLELVSFNNYHPDIIKVITNSGGYWSSNKLGREWKVTPQKDGYTFEPSTLHEGWAKPDPSTWIVKGNANDIDFTGMSDESQNHPPVITSTAVTSATKDAPYSYNVNATDSDGDTLVYSLTTKPAGMTINSTTGLIAWTPTTSGDYDVTVKVSDGELSATQSFTITVSESNHAPVITSTAVTSATKDEPYSYDVNATDSDGDTLIYSLTTNPSGMSINSSTGLINWTPTTSGEYNVTVKVSDGELSATQSFTITVGVEGDYVVEFEDHNLEQAVREAIDKPEGPLYLSDVIGITTLYAYNRGIISLEGIQHLQNLQYLSFYSNQVSDISVLSNLTNMQQLTFSTNQVSDISALQNLTNLLYLSFHSNQVSDISALQNLTNLHELNFDYNQVSDISVLSNLTNLQELSFDGNQISDISALQNLTNLQALYFENNQVSDISALQNLTKLLYLVFRQNQVSDISALENLTNLRSLIFYSNQVSDISALQNLTNLTDLVFHHNQVSDISALQNLTNLSDLWFSTNQVSDISALQNLTNLWRLSFVYNQVSDISALVKNEGFSSGDYILMGYNYLDLAEGSQNMQDIENLISRGVDVDYEPQRNP